MDNFLPGIYGKILKDAPALDVQMDKFLESCVPAKTLLRVYNKRVLRNEDRGADLENLEAGAAWELSEGPERAAAEQRWSRLTNAPCWTWVGARVVGVSVIVAVISLATWDERRGRGWLK